MKTKLFLTIGCLLSMVMTAFCQKLSPFQSVDINQKYIAFTFDDGPDPKTSFKIMDLMESVDGKATFFNIGKKLSEYSALSKNVIERGHEIGNHSMSHRRFKKDEELEARIQEIKAFQSLAEQKLHYTPKLYRAPFLDYFKVSNTTFQKLQLTPVNAAVYAKDAKKNVEVDAIVHRIMNGVKPGVVVLCHERKHTIKALEQVLPKLKLQGYHFVTVSELMAFSNHKKIASNHPFIKVSGTNYAYVEDQIMRFPRHSAELLKMPKGKSKFSPVKAQTGSGVVVSFKTSSPIIKASFKVLQGENRGGVFAVYQDGKKIQTLRFGKKDNPEKIIEIQSKLKHSSVFQIIIPHWTNVGFKGLELEEGHSLEKIAEDKKPIYVAYGNSITHGTGQQATFQTYPFLLAKKMNWNLYNVAVGGGKTSVPMAKMIRDDFEHIDFMTILIGYNDYNGEGLSSEAYGKRLSSFIQTIREKHPSTNLFCITPTYTKTKQSKKSGQTIVQFRDMMASVVKSFQHKGDAHLFLIRGEKISKESDLKDVVHFNVDGAKSFSELLYNEIKIKLDQTTK